MTQTTRPLWTDAELFYQLTTFVRETTQEFFTATSRDDIVKIVRERFRESDLYTVGRIIDILPDVVLAEHDQRDGGWTVSSKAILLDESILANDMKEFEQLPEFVTCDDGKCAFVSLEAGRLVYGGLIIHANRPNAFNEGELATIEWFGDTISQAINAVENQRMLFANAVTELRIDCPNTPIHTVADAASCRLSLESFVPTNQDQILTYWNTSSASPKEVKNVAEAIDEIEACRIIGGDNSAVVEFVITDGSPLFAFADGIANLSTALADEQSCTVVAETSSGTCAAPLMDRIRDYCPDAKPVAKRENNLIPPSGPNRFAPPTRSLDSLTDRQHEVLEAAYRGGYFRWPRESTAEDIAEALGISPPTLHKHLRRAQEQLFEELFE